MKIAVCVKAVPENRRLDPGSKRLDRSGDLALSSFDPQPIEEALRIKERTGDGEVVLISMGPVMSADGLR